MDFHELDTAGVLVEPSVDLSTVTPISQPRVLTFVNYWLETHAQFINTFASQCDAALFDVEQRVDRMDASLMILEAKLASVPWLNEERTDRAEEQKKDEQPVEQTASTAPTTVTVEKVEESESVPDRHAEVETSSETPSIKEHPYCIKYFKMLKFGIPPTAVKLKMMSEGLDPDLLDTPDASASGAGLPEVADNEEDGPSDSD